MNKRLLLVVAVLLCMATLKYAFGQGEVAIGWDLPEYDPMQDLAAVMLVAPILGTIFGALRLLRTKSARPMLEPLRLR